MVDVVLDAKSLSKTYGRRGHAPVHALVDASLVLERGKTFGIVGESGSGKSTLARLLVGLESPTAGSLDIDGQAMKMRARGDNRALARKIQLVFQDPFSSLDPRLTVERALKEVLHVHRLHQGKESERVAELLAMVGLTGRFAARYPHELSGGQAQRVAIARALAVEPEVLVLDEPTSALDVSVRAEIINLLVRIQDDLNLSYVFVSHDLSMVRHISDQIAVMYLGRVVEMGSYAQVFDAPLHPYTVALAEAIPVPDPEHERARTVKSRDHEPLQAAVIVGCPYAPRCPLVEPYCREVAPTLTEKVNGHLVSCHVAMRLPVPDSPSAS
jgi:oligopeptide/dipeptide ABC transporter ATP-binding protein